MGLRRSAPILRGGPPRKSNPARRKKEFQRTYHSAARVEFVKALPCAASGMDDGCGGPIENAHTRTDGMGRKAGYNTIAPLCRKHHSAYDERRGLLASPWARYLVIITAAKVQAAWLAHTESDE